MHLDNLATLTSLESFKAKSKDGEFLAPAIVKVFQELQEKLVSDLDDFKSQLMKITEKQDERIQKLTNENKILHSKLEKVEEKIDAEDAYERKDSLILSGEKIPAFDNNENVLTSTVKLLKDNLNYILHPTEISVLHRLQEKKNRQGAPDHRDIYVKFCRRSVRKDILEAARKKKVEGFFINEALTPVRQTIAYVLRQAKRKFPDIVSGSTTQDGKNYVWIHPPNRNAPGAKSTKLAVHTHSRLEKFCVDTLGKPLTDFIQKWDH